MLYLVFPMIQTVPEAVVAALKAVAEEVAALHFLLRRRCC
jgi:hypothetical protein